VKKEFLDKTIQFINKHSSHSSKIDIGFMGGEPTLAFEKMKYFVKKLQESNIDKDLKFHLTTNGSLLSPRIINFFYLNNFFIHISIDGPEDIHNRYRRFKNGGPTFNIIINNLRILKERHSEYYNSYVGFLCLLHPPYNLKKVFDFFNDNELFINNPVKYNVPIEDGSTFYEKFSETDINDYYIQKNKCYKDLVRKISNGIDVKDLDRDGIFTMYKSRLSRIYYRKHNPQDYIYPNGICMPLLRKTFINEDGKIFICERMLDRLCLGNIFNDIDRDKINEILDKYIEMCNPYKNCWLARICDHCWVSSIDDNKLSLIKKQKNCINTKSIYKEVFELYIFIYEQKSIFDNLYKIL
jgi:uncharacterized protein